MKGLEPAMVCMTTLGTPSRNDLDVRGASHSCKAFKGRGGVQSVTGRRDERAQERRSRQGCCYDSKKGEESCAFEAEACTILHDAERKEDAGLSIVDTAWLLYAGG